MPTDSLLGAFAFAFAVSLGAVVSPGPVSAAVVSQAPRHGWRVGPWVSAGHALLELIVVLLIAFGLSAGLGEAGPRRVVALAGGLLLLWMGGSYVVSVVRGRMRLPQGELDHSLRSGASLLTMGILTTISNPFWYAWWMTIAAAYLAQARALGALAVTAFYLGHISADFAWNTALATATTAGRRWLTDGRYQALILFTGGFMLYLGVVFLRLGLTGT
jgi:threonine/homoserine/homoserine lactone efflux protein